MVPNLVIRFFPCLSERSEEPAFLFPSRALVRPTKKTRPEKAAIR